MIDPMLLLSDVGTAAASAGYVQITLIWVVYAVAVALLLSFACLFVYLYQTHRDRSIFVTIVCIFTITCLLATVLLLPVDVALVSSTTSSTRGVRKDWANQGRVDNITYTLRIVYYLLYSVDAILCLLVVPFTYFWYEEYDEVAQEEGSQTFGSRFWGAFKFTLIFIMLCVTLFVVGFFVPVARHREGAHFDLDFFKKLLAENHGERALTFALGLLITIGVLFYCFYTAAGLALLPLTLIKTAPGISAPALGETSAAQLESNLERQRQLEGRAQGNPDGLSSKDQRELDALVREERTLRRHQRLAAEASGENQNIFWKIWIKLEAVFRPIKLILGLLLVVVVLLIFVSMLITGIDKAKNSICKRHCGYLLAHINIFQPINWILVTSAKVFPIDYVIFLLLVMLFFSASIIGIATIGIRVLWITVFRIRKAHTSPQALLIATVMLTLMTLAINYSIAMMVAPQYATFGPQTFCDHPLKHPGEQPDCSDHPQHIVPCTELSDNPAARNVCTPSVVSTFLNRVTVNFPFFGVVDFWAQFAFLGIFMIGFIVLLFRTPKLSDPEDDEDALEEEEEGLLASTGRRFGATWQDITGRVNHPNGQGQS
ncbi:LMBR1-like membrane protein-domain-containing protein [Exophiala viscosa]|uniref:LMBR1-like membrane protein-domain-containing protein n=1 Tax=Exophiala viscosa TaxID=2486360 RepID=UPI00219B5058|nr:LMBR1-like membrane protein-domain-containing protein [Exophiala viscosa]